MNIKSWILLGLGSLLALGLLTGCTSGWGAMGSGMMSGSPGWGSVSSGTPIPMDQAIEIAQRYVSALGLPQLELSEIMEFDNHFYVAVEEANTGTHAFEILVDRFSGQVHPEPGPNMMWNQKYGHMGMMGFGPSNPGGPMAVSPEQAREYAQRYLNRALPGTTVSEEADAFYGYYTLHLLQDGQVLGMLSVHGTTGEVWYHSWHGALLGMKEF
jgi:hypothetical protein